MPIIRPATSADAPFIADGAYRAFLLPENHPLRSLWLSVLEDVCSRTDTQYSYANTLIAESGTGEQMGLLICVDGRRYHEQRMRTLPYLTPLFDAIFGKGWAEMEDEGKPGDLYLDTLSVLPQFRNQGIGTALIQAAKQKARQLGIGRLTLAVDPANPAKQLYLQLGFCYERPIFIFNEHYHLLACNLAEQES